jgi:hypothetical protein
MLNIPPEYSQSYLDRCFESGGVDTEARGPARQIALSKFFKALMQCRGLQNRSQMALAIALDSGLGEDAAEKLQKTIHHMAGPEGNAELESPVDSLSQTRKSNPTARMEEQFASAISRYAYPDSEALQQACMDFLTSMKYCLQGDELHSIKSAATTRGWQNRANNGSGRAIG